MVKPDTRRGLLYMKVEDELLHFCWKDRKTNAVEDDLILFGDAEFLKCKQSNERVYVLKFKSSDQRLFFWLQEPKTDKDDELVAKVNNLINNPPMGGDEGEEVGGDDAFSQGIMQFLASQGVQPSPTTPSARSASPTRAAAAATAVASTPAPAASATTTSAAAATPATAGTNKVQMDQLRNILRNIQVPATAPTDLDLSDVLTPENLTPLLQNESVRSSLFPHLPADASTPKTREEVEAVIRSPQFRSSVSSLTYALRSGQLGPLLREFGLESADAARAGGGVRGFLGAIQSKVSKQNQDGDSMDTDN